ncbi:hypothetical protein LguiB_011219 [Lonicera macranthoides]
MGVISRKVMPACGQLCFFCPAMRPRSRQPVKRYKKLLSDIFPRSPDAEPNDRGIGKLCEYASKNPLRIPKITTSLEQRCYRELRNENFGHVKVVMRIYRKLVISCKQQMPLFAGSFLSIIHILLDQTRHDEIRTIGCEALFDFINFQRDSTYMFNIEGLIPKLCLLAQEIGDGERVEHLHAASLQALSAAIWFMGEFSHMSSEFDNVVSVVLENCGDSKEKFDKYDHNQDNQEAGNFGDNDSPSNDVMARATSWSNIVNERGELIVTMEDAKNPKFWSRVCLSNMAKLAKEATTVRRVLESLFRYFDTNDLWSPEHGLALSVLLDMQLILANSGQNAHFLLSTLIKHLDHKNVLKNPNMQVDIIDVATSLAQSTNVQPSVAIVGAFSDMMRHLRKSIHCSIDDSDLGEEIVQWNKKFQASVNKCLVQLSHKVGDPGPILDIMAGMLESISNITVMARNTIAAVYRTAQIVASVPNLSYENKAKAFPEALFHQLLIAMVSPDHETRVGAHRVFAVVLVPSSVCPRPHSNQRATTASNIQRTLSRTVSVFSSSAALFQKMGKENTDGKDDNKSMLNRLTSSYSRAYSTRRQSGPITTEETTMSSLDKESEAISLRLSFRQISLLLSSLWVQAISPLNTPENYEAIAHTYSLVVLFSRTKNSSRDALIKSIQLGFSLRRISLGETGPLQPSRRRSLFTLAMSMIIFSSKAYNIITLIPSAKAALTDHTIDPFLQLVDDCKLKTVNNGLDSEKVYGTKVDNENALKSLAAIKTTGDQSTESFASMIVKNFGKQSKQESLALKENLLKDFLPDDACPLGAELFAEEPEQLYQANNKDNKVQDEAEHPMVSLDDDFLPNLSESKTASDRHLSEENPSLLSVNQFLDSVSETTNKVGMFSSYSKHYEMPYKEMASNCEELVVRKHQKMSSLSGAELEQCLAGFSADDDNKSQAGNHKRSNSKADTGYPMNGNPFTENNAIAILDQVPIAAAPTSCGTEYQHHPDFFKLPASSPYDNFLKAAGG